MLEQTHKPIEKTELPPIPEKRYFTIGEVGALCGVKPHVLRYWEQEFKQIKPVKRRGNRRYYQRKDIIVIRHIRSLLYDRGYTIGGAKQQLAAERGAPLPSKFQDQLQTSIQQLEGLLQLLES